MSGEASGGKSIKEVEIPVPWGVVRGKWWGSDEVRPVLAIHGWQDNAGTFDALIPLLSDDVSLLCIDLPGHGLSTHYPKGMTYYLFWDTLVLIRRIVKYYNWDKVSILGHSLGGASGFLYAAVYPDEVDKLVSIDIVCPRVGLPEVIIKQTPECIDKFLKYENLSDVPAGTYEDMIDIALNGHQGSITRESCELLMRRGMQLANNETEKFRFSRDPRLKVAGLAMFSREEVLAYASKIKCEYLNIRAVPGLRMEIPELYAECLDNIKASAKVFQYIEVNGTHHVHLNEPSLINDTINSFLTAHFSDSLNVNNNHEDLIV